MAEKIGEFTMKHVVSSYNKDKNGNLTARSDWKGAGSSATLGTAQVFGSFTTNAPLSDGNAKSGAVEFAGESFLEDGTTIANLAAGTWEKPENQHSWHIVMEGKNSLGHTRRYEGKADLETLTFTGEIYSID